MPTCARAAPRPADPPLPWVRGLALAPNGDLLVADGGVDRVLRLAQPLPGFTDDGISIASEDGTEVYEFSRDGRHLRTVDALTGRVVYRFVYDDAGRLIEIRDAVDDVTRIERDAERRADRDRRPVRPARRRSRPPAGCSPASRDAAGAHSGASATPRAGC